MAKRRKKKGLTPPQKVIAAGLVLVVVLGGVYAFLASKSKPQTVKEAIASVVEERQDIDQTRKAQMKIQLALADYRDKKGQYPETLSELQPEYFDRVPSNPDTNQPFEYRVVGGQYMLGSNQADGGRVTTDTARATKEEENSDSQEDLLIASLNDDSAEVFIYDASGKRDPFLPFDYSPQNSEREKLTPLERFEIGQLKLTAVLDGFEEPYAMVEAEGGKGFKVKKGTKIGPNGGEVVEIHRDKLMILEVHTDFTGESKNKIIELRLRTAEEESNLLSNPVSSSKTRSR